MHLMRTETGRMRSDRMTDDPYASVAAATMQSRQASKAMLFGMMYGAHQVNQVLVEGACNAVEEFTRRKLHEDGFWRKILPPLACNRTSVRYTQNVRRDEFGRKLK